MAGLSLETPRMLGHAESRQQQWNEVVNNTEPNCLSTEMTKHDQTTSSASEPAEPLLQRGRECKCESENASVKS